MIRGAPTTSDRNPTATKACRVQNSMAHDSDLAIKDGLLLLTTIFVQMASCFGVVMGHSGSHPRNGLVYDSPRRRNRREGDFSFPIGCRGTDSMQMWLTPYSSAAATANAHG